MNARHKEEQKLLLRKKMRGVLQKIPPSARLKKSQKIIAKLLRSRRFKEASALVTYVALPTEVQTKHLIEEALRLGKKVFVPKVKRDQKKFTLHGIRDYKKDLIRGSFGILEPKKHISPSKRVLADLIVVPGLGFDRQGRRLGRGGGYYDRFLACRKQSYRIGLAFKEQIIRGIPIRKHDMRVHKVIIDGL